MTNQEKIMNLQKCKSGEEFYASDVINGAGLKASVVGEAIRHLVERGVLIAIGPGRISDPYRYKRALQSKTFLTTTTRKLTNAQVGVAADWRPL